MIVKRNARCDYLTDGTQNLWGFDFALWKPAGDTQITVFVKDLNTKRVTTIESGYSVDMVNRTVLYPSIPGTQALASGKTVIVARNLPIVQETELRHLGSYSPVFVEGGLDYRCLIEQQIAEGIGDLLKGYDPLNIVEELFEARDIAIEKAAQAAQSAQNAAQSEANAAASEEAAAESAASIPQMREDLNAHIENKENPHEVTKEQVGLGNADNTSDADKPISTATQAAIDGINSDLSEHIEDKNNPHEVKIEQIENLQDELDDAKNYTDERVAEAQLANQKWLPAVQTKADLPTPTNTEQTYLCRVIADATAENNGVWQWIGGGDEWTYFSDNLDFIDETELAQAISEHNTDNTAHSDIRTAINGKTSPADVDAKIATHNTSETAHNDIRQILNGKASATDIDTKIAEHNTDNSAHANKVDKEAGKGLSSNDFTTAEKEKLAGMAAGGQANIIESIALNGNDLPIVDKAVNIEISERVLVRDEATANITLATALKNTTYKYWTLTSLTINAFEDSNEEIIVQFYSGSSPTVLILPNMPKITPIPTIEPNTWYELSVLNGVLAMSQGVQI